MARRTPLEKKIEELRQDISNERLSMSIGELAGLYERSEMDIHPKFQRILRWTPEQKTKLVESILLRIPIPPIFVAQDPDGRWDVVDGVQRLGTLFEFLGLLRGPDGNLKPRFKLVQTQLLPELAEHTFEDNPGGQSFTSSQRLDFRRSRLDINIILKESDPYAKYELFERLNTGGAIASPQEVRNCVLVWINEQLFDWIEACTQDVNFREAVPLSERLEDEEYRTELLLRFLVFYRIAEGDLRAMRDVTEFLNMSNRNLATNVNYDKEREGLVFRDTFALINRTAGADAFRKYDAGLQTFRGAFLISAYEAVGFGVAHNIQAWKDSAQATERLMQKIKAMWQEADFTNHIGPGVAAKPRLQRTIPFGRRFFTP